MWCILFNCFIIEANILYMIQKKKLFSRTESNSGEASVSVSVGGFLRCLVVGPSNSHCTTLRIRKNVK